MYDTDKLSKYMLIFCTRVPNIDIVHNKSWFKICFSLYRNIHGTLIYDFLNPSREDVYIEGYECFTGQ